jgi:imidazolonepropionase-like amidohydrolase
MTLSIVRRSLTGIALCATVLAAPTTGTAATTASTDLAITGATVIPAPDEAPISGATVLVRDGRIAALGRAGTVKIPARTPRLDARGLTVLAGFWNSHVHLIGEPMLRAATLPVAKVDEHLDGLFLRWGFTSVFDLASNIDTTLALRQRIDAGEVNGPCVLTVGSPFYPQAGTPIYIREWYRSNGIPSDEVATPAEAEARARAQLARGTDGAKAFTGAIIGGPAGVKVMQREIAQAAFAPAAEHGQPRFAHPTTPDGLRTAVDAGATVLAHANSVGGAWPPDLVRDVVARNVALIPTLALFDTEIAKDGVPDDVRVKFVGAAQQQVRDFRAAGGTLLFGTDVGFSDETDPALEYRLLVGSGLDARAILAMLTTAPAKRFGVGDRLGRVERGYVADLVIVRGDPLADPQALRNVAYTLRSGTVVHAADGVPRPGRTGVPQAACRVKREPGAS